MLSEVPGISRQPFAMPLGVRVTSLHAESQRLQDGFRVLQLISEFLDLEQRLHAREEFFGKKRLGQELVGSGFFSAYTVIAVAESSDHDDGDKASRRVLFQLAAQLVAGAAGHDHVQQDQVWMMGADRRPRLATRRGRRSAPIIQTW